MAKSKCMNIFPLIPLLVDGALSASESDRLKKHLSVCPDCRREFDLYRAMKHTTATLAAPQLSIGFHENLMKTIEEEAATQKKRTSSLRPHLRRKTMGYVATAAAAAVVALSVVTQSQISFFGMPKTFPSDNLDDFAAQPQVAQSQVAQSQVTQSQVAQSQVAQSQVAQSQVTQPRVAQSQGTESQVATPIADEPIPSIDSQVAQPQVAEPQGTTPVASCGIEAEEPQKIFATYRVFIKKAYLPKAEELLADCPKDEHGYRADSGATPLLEALSALPGYRTECIENGTEQPLTADYILLIGE